jgi:hypothetical protein
MLKNNCFSTHADLKPDFNKYSPKRKDLLLSITFKITKLQNTEYADANNDPKILVIALTKCALTHTFRPRPAIYKAGSTMNWNFHCFSIYPLPVNSVSKKSTMQQIHVEGKYLKKLHNMIY